MTDYTMVDDFDDDMGDFDAGGSTNSDNEKVDSILIKKILCEMKSEFNRATCSVGDENLKEEEEMEVPALELPAKDNNSDQKKTVLGNGFLCEKTDDESKESEKDNVSLNNVDSSDMVGDIEDEVNSTKDAGKPRIVLTLRASEDEKETNINQFKKRTIKQVKVKSTEFACPDDASDRRGRRSLRNIVEKVEQDIGLKRSSRRMSKELAHESVLQSAIALKEKSFSSLNHSEDKPYRRSSRFSEGDLKHNPPNKKLKSLRHSQGENADSSSNNSSNNCTRMTRGIKTSVDIDSKMEDQVLDNGNTDDGVKQSAKSQSSVKSQRRHPRQIKDCESSRTCNITPTRSQSVESDSGRGSENTPNLEPEVSSPCENVCIQDLNEEPMNEVKHLKHYVSSPTLVEGSEPPSLPDSAMKLRMADSGGLCECQSNKGLFPSVSSFSTSMYCRAIDCFENRVIGCCNPVDSDTPLLRPSKTVPHLLMCDVHIQRLMRHNSCPSCGMFCTQGLFMRCFNGHDYHKNCALKKDNICVCPHCGCEDSKEVKICLGTHKYPVFLPMQKPPNKYPSARMSFSSGSATFEKSEKDEIFSLVPQISLTIPSGRKLSSEGIPAVEKEKLEKLLHACSTQNDLLQRYSYRNMYQAAKGGDAEKMIQILGCGMNPNQMMRDGGAVCALHAAASSGHLSVVHLLVQAGANTEVLDKDQNTPLMLAIMNGHNDIVKYLIKVGASVSFKGADGMTALHIAAKEGNLEACHLLLSSASTPPSYVDTVDDGRWTPLVWAAENCHINVIRFLLERKADPQIRDAEMNIALHWAAFAGSMEISEDLLNYGSNINLSNAHGDTPLHIAARQGAENCVVLLLARGARIDMMNKAGHIPRDCVLDPSSYCYVAIDLNMQLRKLMVTTQSYPRILNNDISRGYETNPIQCVNMIDDDGLPTDFTYISENCITTNLNIDRRITSLTSCKCEDMCTGNGCMCAKISLRCWYDSKGKLLPDFNFEDPPMLFECNQTCNCNALTCKNRVVQRGIKVRLQLCKTRHKNWGVITLRDIPKGSYVCEYIGEIISDCEADTREDDSYLFDLDNRDGETYCIDARRYGNITRFINHSCKPNLLPVRVFIGHHDLHFPRIAFFANRDIAANEELGFDYGEKFWIIKCKSFTCRCGTESCRYSDETIQETLQKYKENLLKEEVR